MPSWLVGWSALNPRADLPRRLPGSGTALPTLLWSEPQISLFWTAANPAGLANPGLQARTDFIAARARERGTYRRPLDPGGRSLEQLMAQSWAPLAANFNVLGRVLIDRENADPGTLAEDAEPYASSPFATADTTASATHLTRARLEGAAGWRLRHWSLGLTLGYEARDRETIVAPLVRRSGRSGSGVVFGLSRGLGSVRIGVHGGFRNHNETIDVFQKTGPGEVIQLEGYRDGPIIGVNAQNSYYRRIDGNEPWGGVGIEHQGRTRWLLFADRSRLAEQRTRQQQDAPALDRWRATGWSVGAAASRRIGGSLATVQATVRSLHGAGSLALDTVGFKVTADERSVLIEAELRRKAEPSQWAGVVGVTWWYQDRHRANSLPDLSANVKSATPTLWGELGLPISGSARVIVGGSFSRYGAIAKIPNPQSRSVFYQRFLAPELDLAARAATPFSFRLGFKYRLTGRTDAWLAGRIEELRPSGSAGPTQFGPSGTRSAASLVVGVSVGPPGTR